MPYEPIPTNYWITLAIHTSVLASTAWILGEWVVRRAVKVNYTRKLNHFVLFVTPFALAPIFPYVPNAYTLLISAVVFVLTTLLFLKSIRERFSMVNTAFASVDRPEDRPHTLLWIVTQALTTYTVMLIVLMVLNLLERPELIVIPVLVTAIGDGLAEPVGVRFGRVEYRVPSLASGRRYVRTIAGSACVFLTSVAVVLSVSQWFSTPEWIAATIAIPPLMTFAEAFAPHSWDAPFLYIVGGIGVAAVVVVV